MKIGLLGTAADTRGQIPAELAEAVLARTELDMFPVAAPIFAHSPVELALQQVNYLDAGLRAADAGCDTIVCVSTADYAVPALRDVLPVPVIGSGEAAYALARTVGARFSLVTVWPETTNFVHFANLRRCGMTAKLTSIRNVLDEAELASEGRPDALISGMQGGDAGTFGRIVEACLRAEREDDPDLLVLGCTCMSPIADCIAQECSRPVINPFVAAVRMAETLRAGRRRDRHPVRPETRQILAGMMERAVRNSQNS